MSLLYKSMLFLGPFSGVTVHGAPMCMVQLFDISLNSTGRQFYPLNKYDVLMSQTKDAVYKIC